MAILKKFLLLFVTLFVLFSLHLHANEMFLSPTSLISEETIIYTPAIPDGWSDPETTVYHSKTDPDLPTKYAVAVVVMNENGQVLFAKRNPHLGNTWSLPSSFIDKEDDPNMIKRLASDVESFLGIKLIDAKTIGKRMGYRVESDGETWQLLMHVVFATAYSGQPHETETIHETGLPKYTEFGFFDPKAFLTGQAGEFELKGSGDCTKCFGTRIFDGDYEAFKAAYSKGNERREELKSLAAKLGVSTSLLLKLHVFDLIDKIYPPVEEKPEEELSLQELLNPSPRRNADLPLERLFKDKVQLLEDLRQNKRGLIFIRNPSEPQPIKEVYLDWGRTLDSLTKEERHAVFELFYSYGLKIHIISQGGQAFNAAQDLYNETFGEGSETVRNIDFISSIIRIQPVASKQGIDAGQIAPKDFASLGLNNDDLEELLDHLIKNEYLFPGGADFVSDGYRSKSIDGIVYLSSICARLSGPTDIELPKKFGNLRDAIFTILKSNLHYFEDTATLLVNAERFRKTNYIFMHHPNERVMLVDDTPSNLIIPGDSQITTVGVIGKNAQPTVPKFVAMGSPDCLLFSLHDIEHLRFLLDLTQGLVNPLNENALNIAA